MNSPNGTRIGRLIAEQTDIPPGVVNVVTSSDHMIGEELVLDPRVDMISFTGSTATGRRILKKSGPTLKRAFLELGGKSAMVVLDDADLASVIPLASFMCIHAGQGCVLQTRLLVPRPKYEESLDPHGGLRSDRLRRPHRHHRDARSPGRREATRQSVGLHQQGDRRRSRGWSPAAAVLPAFPPDSSSNQPCLPMSTTR